MSAEPSPDPAPRRRRRWPRVLGWTLAGAVVLVALAPLYAGPLLAGVVVRQIEERLDAEARVRAVAFAWPATVRVRGLAALLSGAVRASLEVRYPELHVSRAPDGAWNWQRVLARPGPEEEPEEDRPEDDAELPDVAARVRVVDGHVVVHGKDGVTSLSDVELALDLDGLARPAPFAFHLAVRGPRGAAGRIRLDGEVTLASGGRVAPEELAGELALALEELDLAALAPALALVAPAEGLEGRLAGVVELVLAPGLALTGTADVALRDLALRGPLADAPARVASVRLEGRATQAGAGAGTLALALAADDFLALEYDGRSHLPADGAGEVAGTLELTADLARVAELARGWVRLQEGVTLQGRVEHVLEVAATLEARAPRTLSATAHGGVTGLAARDAAGRALDLSALETIALELEAAADVAAGTLTVPRLDLRAGPLALTGHVRAGGLALGPPSEPAPDASPRIEGGELVLDADLESLRSTLAQLVDLAGLPFGGRVTARASVEADADGGHALAAEIDARALALGGTRVGELRAELRGRLGLDGAVGGTGDLAAGGLVLALGDAEPLALPDVTARVELAADARGAGRHALELRTADGALALALTADSARPAPDELALDATFELDARLAPLAALAGERVPLATGLAGELRGTGELSARADGDGLVGAGGSLALELADLAARGADGRALPLAAFARTSLALAGELDARGNAAELRSFTLRADGLELSAAGRAYGLASGTPALEDAEVRLAADLARVGPDLERALELGWTVGGSPLSAAARLSGGDGRLRVEGELTAAELVIARADAAPLVQRELTLELDLGYDAGAGSLDVRRAKASSTTGSFALTGTLVELADPARARGTMRLELAAELERVAADLGLEPPGSGRATSGPLRGAFHLDGDSGAFRVSGGATIEPFRLVLTSAADAPEAARPEGALGKPPPPAPLVVEEPKVALEVDARVELARLDVEIAKLTLDSRLARGGAQGRVRNLAGAGGEPVRFERFTGELAYVPDRLGAVLAPWLPGELQGAEEERATFALDGALPALDLAGVLRGAEARFDLGLGRFVRPEVALDGGLGLESKDGRAMLRADLTANGGTLQVDGTLDLSDAPRPRSRLMATGSAVRLNAGLAPLLARVHPLFAGADLAQGTLDGLLTFKLDLAYEGPLTVEQLAAGWEELPKTPIGGSGSLELAELALRGSPLLAGLAELGLRVPEKLAPRPIQFSVQRGRLVYAEPWTWTIGDVQTTFTGSVGLDRTLDLAWNVPITEELVARHSFLRFLSGETLSIPLRGNALAPRLELDGLLKDLAAQAAKRELESRIGLGSGGKDDPGELLKRADDLWSKGEKAEAAKLYARLRDEFKLSLTYALNKDRIRERSKHEDE